MMVMKTSNAYSLIIFAVLLLYGCYLIDHVANAEVRHHNFVIKSSSYTRLCSTKNILTVNDEFPGPTLKAHTGDTLIVNCPIQPGAVFKQVIHLTTEEGTIWWHGHDGWSRATVHGAFIIYPKHGQNYPFPKPHAEIPILLIMY
ncbi:hypothetical protein HN51_058037 [Arachis hypogaea]